MSNAPASVASRICCICPPINLVIPGNPVSKFKKLSLSCPAFICSAFTVDGSLYVPPTASHSTLLICCVTMPLGNLQTPLKGLSMFCIAVLAPCIIFVKGYSCGLENLLAVSPWVVPLLNTFIASEVLKGKFFGRLLKSKMFSLNQLLALSQLLVFNKPAGGCSMYSDEETSPDNGILNPIFLSSSSSLNLCIACALGVAIVIFLKMY